MNKLIRSKYTPETKIQKFKISAAQEIGLELVEIIFFLPLPG
jgi:hypothetical protein